MAFWFNSSKKQKKPRCLITNTASVPLAHGDMLNTPDDGSEESESEVIKIALTDEEDVALTGVVQVIPQDDKYSPWMGQVVVQHGKMLLLQPMRASGAMLRQNLRMPMDFLSEAIPKSGISIPIRACDLSCGGIAFYSAGNFAVGEKVKVVIPVTEPAPLTLTCEILRKQPYQEPICLFACQFDGVTNIEERQLREAVFTVQLKRNKV